MRSRLGPSEPARQQGKLGRVLRPPDRNPRIRRQERQIDEISSIVVPPRGLEPEQELDDVAEANLGSCRRPLAHRRRKPDAVQDGKWYGQDHGVGGVGVAVLAPDQCATMDLLDGGDRRTEPDRNAAVAALRCEEFDERAVATDDAPLRMMSANHPFVAKDQGAGPLRIRRVVTFGHPLDGTPQHAVFGTGETASQEFGDGQIIRQALQAPSEARPDEA